MASPSLSQSPNHNHEREYGCGKWRIVHATSRLRRANDKLGHVAGLLDTGSNGDSNPTLNGAAYFLSELREEISGVVRFLEHI